MRTIANALGRLRKIMSRRHTMVASFNRSTVHAD